MTFAHRIGASVRLASVAAGFMFLASGAFAQDATPEHLKAARSAIAAIGATNQFDIILPQASEALKQQLIQKDPNLEQLITSTVDNETLALVARRADLENEAARVYAKVFTQEELQGIADFYSTPIGKKLISDGPLATRQLNDAAGIWQAGIARDLAKNVGEKLKAAAPAVPANGAAPAPADGAAPAPADGTAPAPADGATQPEAPKQ